MNDPPIEDIARAVQENRFAEVERLCRDRLHESSGDPDLKSLLAWSLHRQSRLDEALAIYAELATSSSSSEHWGNYATVLHEVGRLEDAEAAFNRALDCDSVEADTLLNYGLLLLRLEKWVQARSVLLRAHATDPASAPISLAAAQACGACGDYRLDQLLENWRSWLPLENEDQLTLARMLLMAGDAQSARLLVEEVAQRAPGVLAVLLQLAGIYERLNRLDDAGRLLSQIQQSGTELDPAWQSEFAHQRATLLMRSGRPDEAKGVLLQAGPRSDADFGHYFELARAYDRSGQIDAAMAALRAGHVLQVQKLASISPNLFQKHGPVFARTSVRISPQAYAAWPQLIAPEARQSPAFVVGFPRSGTTLLEQMLDSHPSLQSMDERPFFNILADQLEDFGAHVPDDLGNLSQQDCDELRKGYLLLACSKVPRRWQAQLVDKNPMNMLWLPMIHRLYPRAKWILALRHPCDVILSCYMQSFRANVLASACADLARLARGYVEAMEYWLHHVRVLHPDVMVSRYEELVSDAPGQLRKIASFLNLDDSGPMLDFNRRAIEKGFIATPSYTQVIEPVNRRSIGKWRRYREYFEPILPILQPMLDYWDYAVDTQPE